MSNKKQSQEKKIRIHNPVTNSYYQIQQKSTTAGKRGSIMRKWSSKKK
jgi:hypothetical protein